MSEDNKTFELNIPNIEKQKEIVDAVEKELKTAKTEEEKAAIVQKHLEAASSEKQYLFKCKTTNSLSRYKWSYKT